MNFLLAVKFSHFLFSWYVKIYQSIITLSYHYTLTSFKLFLFFHFQCLRRYICGHNLTMKFPLDFHRYTGLNGLVMYLSSFTMAPPNTLILKCKPHWSAKRKKHVRSGCSAKTFSWKFHKIHTCACLFPLLLKTFRPPGLQIYWETPILVFQSQSFEDHL